MKPLLIVAGLAREARAAGKGVSCVLSGADGALLRARLAEIDPADYAGVVSFGLAGGLEPTLKPGALVLGARAVVAGATYDCAPQLVARLAAGLRARRLAFTQGVVAGVERPALGVADKAALRARTRAIAVDMESHVAGDFAARARLPFAILRATSDPADRALPALAAAALDGEGRVRLGHVLGALARRPGDAGALLAAGRDARAAFRSLRKCRGMFA